ncbi:MAG: hypothetical protein C0504_01045 [Candidatus Solibacter sp.]|nr:hypothetical protein [Candidatus Solibacter sp.]
MRPGGLGEAVELVAAFEDAAQAAGGADDSGRLTNLILSLGRLGLSNGSSLRYGDSSMAPGADGASWRCGAA